MHYLIGAVVGAAITWAVMKYVSPSVVKDKITGEVIRIEHAGRSFIDSVKARL